MSYKQEQIDKLQTLITETNLKQIIIADLTKDVWNFLELTKENIYGLGICVNNREFYCIQFTANSYEGLESEAKKYSLMNNKSYEYNYNKLKWNTGDWKYFPFKTTSNINQLNAFNLEFNDFMSELKEFDEVYEGEISEEQEELLFSYDGKEIPEFPEYFELDFFYDELVKIVQKEVVDALIEVRRLISKEDLVVSVFGGDVSGEFLVSNCLQINGQLLADEMKKDLITAYRYK
jgi:hypothetical protein